MDFTGGAKKHYEDSPVHLSPRLHDLEPLPAFGLNLEADLQTLRRRFVELEDLGGGAQDGGRHSRVVTPSVQPFPTDEEKPVDSNKLSDISVLGDSGGNSRWRDQRLRRRVINEKNFKYQVCQQARIK